jgi:hypothetical protein
MHGGTTPLGLTAIEPFGGKSGALGSDAKDASGDSSARPPDRTTNEKLPVAALQKSPVEQ